MRHVLPMEGRSLFVQISKEQSYHPPMCWYHSNGNKFRYNFAADSFYILKTCSRLLILYCQNSMKDDKFRYLIPILRKLGAAQNLGWRLVGKHVYDFLFVINELFSLALTVDTVQGKTCQDSLLLGQGMSLWAKISGERGRPCRIFFGFYKTRHILLSDRANCTVLCAVIFTILACGRATTPSPWNLGWNWCTPSWRQRVLTHFAL